MLQNFLLVDGKELKSIIIEAVNETLINCGQQISQLKEEKGTHKPYLTINEACCRLKITRPTLDKLRKLHKFHWPKLNRLVRIPASDIEILLSITGKEYSNAQ